MTERTPSPIVSQILERNHEVLYIVVERVAEPDVKGDLFRLRAHYHPVGARRLADWSNVIEKDVTGNKCDLRLSFVKFLLDKRDDGWKRKGTASINTLSPVEAEFWRLDTL